MDASKEFILIEKIKVRDTDAVHVDVNGDVDSLVSVIYSGMLNMPLLAKAIMQAAAHYQILINEENKAKQN